jgi:hypothetical protein
MRTPFAAAISIAGVLVAGSAAAMFNSQVFGDTGGASGASAAILPPPSQVVVSVPDATVPPTTDHVTTVAPTTSTATPPTTATRETGMLTAFEVGNAGVVTVDVIEGRLVFVSAEADAGWTIDEKSSDDVSDSNVEVVFRSSTVIVQFDAELVDGVIVPHVESEATGSTAAAQAGQPPAATQPAATQSAPPSTRYDDDDDHDDDEHDDHGEEHGDDRDDD